MKKIITAGFSFCLLLGPFTALLAEEAASNVVIVPPASADNTVQPKTVVVEKSYQPNVRVMPPRPQVIVSESRSAPIVIEKQIVTSVPDYHERELRERELNQREWQLRERENRLNHRPVVVISQQQRAYDDYQSYNRQLRVREWQDVSARDAELRYLLWRQHQQSKYFWYYKGRVCQYVTTYKTGVRTNPKIRICQWRNGVYTCFHPKRYYIYPVTKLICYRPNDRHVLGVIIRDHS